MMNVKRKMDDFIEAANLLYAATSQATDHVVLPRGGGERS